MSRARYRWPGTEPGHSIRDTDLAGLPAAGYFRVSSNPDETETKSVDDQETEYDSWVSRTGVKSGDDDKYKDDDRSASRFAKKQRENFLRVRAAIEAERYKVIWFWSTSRQTRGDIPLDELAAASIAAGVLWSINGQLLNPANDDDMLIAGIHNLMDKQYSARLSKDAQRGCKSIAYEGKPHGQPSYGYRRVYDYTVRIKGGRPKFLRDEPDVFDGNGRPMENSPAYVVCEIYDRIASGDSLGRICRDLEDRGIPTPRPKKDTEFPCRWTIASVRGIATNPAYIGKRAWHAGSTRPQDRTAAILDGVTAQMAPLISDEQWWAVQRILTDPARLRQHTGEGRSYLLTRVVRCGECGAPFVMHGGQQTSSGVRYYYQCGWRQCSTIRVDWLDAYVEDRVVSWLASPEVRASVFGARENDTAVAAAARADLERVQVKIEQWRKIGEDPDSDPSTVDQAIRGLKKKLAEAEELARPASLSPELARLLTAEHVADEWVRLRERGAARQIIKLVADIRVGKSEKSRGGYAPRRTFDESRVTWKWLTGPGT